MPIAQYPYHTLNIGVSGTVGIGKGSFILKLALGEFSNENVSNNRCWSTGVPLEYLIGSEGKKISFEFLKESEEEDDGLLIERVGGERVRVYLHRCLFWYPQAMRPAAARPSSATNGRRPYCRCVGDSNPLTATALL